MIRFLAGMVYLLFDKSALPPHIDMDNDEWWEWMRGLLARYKAERKPHLALEFYQTAIDRQNRRANILTLRWIFWIGAAVVAGILTWLAW